MTFSEINSNQTLINPTTLPNETETRLPTPQRRDTLITAHRPIEEEYCLRKAIHTCISFFKWIIYRLTGYRRPEPLRPVSPELDAFWNRVIEPDWVSADQDPRIENTCRIGNMFSDHLAVACKQAGLTHCRFDRIFAEKKYAASIWFTSEVGYSHYQRRELQVAFNNPRTLFLTARPITFPNGIGGNDFSRRRARESNPHLSQAEFYTLDENDLIAIRDYHEIPDHLRRFLSE